MTDYINPETVTDENGQYLISNSDPTNGYLISDGTNDRIIIGYDKDGFGTGNNFGMKISKAGYDVKTATDTNLIMSSAYNMFKIVATGSGTLTAGAAGTSAYTDVTHGLGVKPVVIAFGYPPDTSQFWGAGYAAQFPVIYYGLTGGLYAWDAFMHVQVTTTNARFAITRSSGSSASAAGTWTYQYYIMVETAV